MNGIENLAATIEALSSPACKNHIDGDPYRNRSGVWGRYFLYWHAEQFHMLSISDCQTLPKQADIVYCLREVRNIDPEKFGFYENKKSSLGYYATFQSTVSFDGNNHWYMLARSNDYKTLYRMRNSKNLSSEMVDLLNYIEQSDQRFK
jgi:hypothetical protein